MRAPFPPPRPEPTGPDLARGFAALRDRQRRWRQRQAIRRLATVAALLVVLMIGGLSLLAVPALYQSARAYQRVFVEPVPHADPNLANPANAAVPRPAATGHDRLTILLLGIDRRVDEPPRSDTMLLVSIDLVGERAAIVSLPRDLRVLVPGHGVQKLNAAYAFGTANDVPGGGPGLAIRTIEGNFGMQVDYFVEIDFEGFVQVIDLAGGITIDVPTAFRDDAYPTPDYGVTTIAFAAGSQRMDGERALVYARTRHADGDLRRTERQRQVLLALRDQADIVSLLPQAPALMTSLGDSVRTDLPPALALDLVRLAAHLSPEAIAEHPLDPILTPVLDQTSDEFLVPDWPALGEMLSRATGAAVVPPAVTDPSLRQVLALPPGDPVPSKPTTISS